MKNPGINLLDWMLTLLAMKGECWLCLNQVCLFSAHCRLCVRVYFKDPSLSRVHGSVDRAIFPCLETMPMQQMDGANAGYIFVPIASCPESGESAFEPLALAQLSHPQLSK